MLGMYRFLLAAIVIGSAPLCANASIRITEIMYDLPGADTGREWIKIHNDGGESVSIADWKFNDGANHVLNEPPKNGGTGSLLISSNGYAILAADAPQCIAEHAVSIPVIDTAMSLGQQNDRTYIISLVRSDGSIEDSVSYTTALGANGDGKSLQLINGVWQAASTTIDTASAQISSDAAAPVSSTESASTMSGSDSGWKIDTNTISAFAGKDREVIVGADTVFSGQAVGTAGEPLLNARFIWSFGDGGQAEGVSALHAFTYPGVYRVALDVSSGKYAAAHQIKVTAVPADISISRVVSGTDSFIELHNKTSRELDLSWWRLKSGGDYFTLPTHTFLLPNAKVAFPFRITRLPILDTADVALLYPNGTAAVVYTGNEGRATFLSHSADDTPSIQTSAASLSKAVFAASNKGALPYTGASASDRVERRDGSLAAAATLSLVQELPKASPRSSKVWIWGTLGIVLLAAGGVFASGKSKKEADELTADDIEIVE